MRKMALSHAIPCGNFAAPSGWVWHFACFCVVCGPPVRAPINMTDQNRASASPVPLRLCLSDPVP
ncbi:hypothetical protein PT2222_240012 [Paraburkholderia tropica]